MLHPCRSFGWAAAFEQAKFSLMTGMFSVKAARCVCMQIPGLLLLGTWQGLERERELIKGKGLVASNKAINERSKERWSSFWKAVIVRTWTIF